MPHHLIRLSIDEVEMVIWCVAEYESKNKDELPKKVYKIVGYDSVYEMVKMNKKFFEKVDFSNYTKPYDKFLKIEEYLKEEYDTDIYLNDMTISIFEVAEVINIGLTGNDIKTYEDISLDDMLIYIEKKCDFNFYEKYLNNKLLNDFLKIRKNKNRLN